jgi:hypothetical protein
MSNTHLEGAAAALPTQNPPTTPQRKRAYRASMRDDSIDASMTELEQLLKEDGMSPSTKKVFNVMASDFEALTTLQRDTPDYYVKQAELLRSEMLLFEILQKDQKYAALQEKNDTLVDLSRILDLGDYHKTNLHILRKTSRSYIIEVNKGKKADARELNYLDDRPWREVIQLLDTERVAFENWTSGTTESPSPPKQPVTDFITKVANRCPRKWTFDQAYFEITEYQRRNSLAHVGIDEWIEDARKERNPKINTKMWEAIAQHIVKDQLVIKRGMFPKHLIGKEHALLESLKIFESYHFDVLDYSLDSQGVQKVNDIKVSEAFLPKQKLEPAAVLKQEILDFDPDDSYEKVLRQEFLEADATLAKLNEEVGNAKLVSEDTKFERKQAERKLEQMSTAFTQYKKWLLANPHEPVNIGEALGQLELTTKSTET